MDGGALAKTNEISCQHAKPYLLTYNTGLLTHFNANFMPNPDKIMNIWIFVISEKKEQKLPLICSQRPRGD